MSDKLNIKDIESRIVVAPISVEKRSEGEEDKPSVIEGTAAIFNTRTKIGNWFYEEILEGAFDDVLKDDVRCLLNHNPNQILGRTASGTLDIWVDKEGLKYRYTTPNRSYAKDLEDAIDSGDVSESSFQFRAEETIWIEQEDDLDIRQIKKVGKLYDVAPVTFPAYQDTSVAKRSFDLRKNSNKKNGKSVREAQLIINKNKSL
ncbi:HK97 family phage prohead protease [Tenacibaculum sp. Mcav3-52]|uniref:HK97 family phage prohead protease n=1 Tax=Tenacibaculum sp. Mcav3-52 TaxID=2917762 RepID=UPI001EF2BE64|nr:HK97 family phage prohead protease [Tenacibaculum sp. Mcav3-52]MCG7502391.1 HK97 family phage prohead protease [Tenacibaculum sp. Mcav3-52]